MYTYAERKFNTRYLVVGKEVGCKQTKRLHQFLNDVLDGDFNSEITTVNEETNKIDFDAVMAHTKAKKTPVLVDLETGKHLAGFKIPKLAKFLS